MGVPTPEPFRLGKDAATMQLWARRDDRWRVTLLTLACFLLASTGWLLWLYHLTSITEARNVNVLTMGIGYPMQALGIAAFAFLQRSQRRTGARQTTSAAIVGYVICLVPAALAPNLAPTLAFGYLANLLCGYMAGYYLFCLARYVEQGYRGIVFGGAYAASTGLGWLLSAVGNGVATHGILGLASCVALSLVALCAVYDMRNASFAEQVQPHETDETSSRQLVTLACIVVTLMSLNKGVGFGFPTTDLLAGVSLELSRLLYGAGLLIAGAISDRDRRYGALCCAAALVMPFLMLALSGASAPATLMWALAYLLNGFFSVFRVVVITDLAAERNRYELAGLGLLFGRIGDSLGTVLSATLDASPLVLITVTAVMFACTIALFFVLYQRLYMPVAEPVLSEREIFERFAARHDLSARERDVLRLLLERHSNAEIASELFVSEATVKFHVRNVLRKTGCKNRTELMALYAEPHE